MKFLIVFLLLSATTTTAMANDSTSHSHLIQKLYVSGGIGSGLTASGSVLFKRNHFCSFHYINETIIVAGKAGFLSSNVTKTYECFSLSYGKTFQWKFIFLNASIGPSYVKYDEPTDIQHHNDWFWSYYTYTTVRHKLPGAFADVQVMFVTRRFGLGIEGYANVNRYNAPIGILGTLNIGLVNRDDD